MFWRACWVRIFTPVIEKTWAQGSIESVGIQAGIPNFSKILSWRHSTADGAAGGPADQVGIKAGDFILAIDDHFLFTIRELKDEASRHAPRTRIRVRYRRYSTISEATLVAGQVD